MKTPINMRAIAALFNVPWGWYPHANFGAGTLLQNGTDRLRVDQAVTLMRAHPEMRPSLRQFLDALNLTGAAREYCTVRRIEPGILDAV